MKRIYMDYAATAPLCDEALQVMIPLMQTDFGNPTSLHSFGRDAIKAVDTARADIADIIGAKPNEIYFTSGGTESDNWALKGIADANKGKGRHIISSPLEHHAVINSLKILEKEGFEITYLPVDEYGNVNPEDVRNAIRPDTILVTVMTANNEIGTIEPIKEIGAVCREKKVYFHTDAVQAMGAVRFDVTEMNIDMLSMSSHKFYGPKGVGVLYIRNGVKISKFMSGGEQERNKRAGTINAAGIAGTAVALKLAYENFEQKNNKLTSLRDHMIKRIESEIPYVRLNGARINRLPNNVNFSFKYIEGESILFNLDLAGIAVSSGSACSSGSLDPSHVLLAIGLPHEIAHGSIRFTLGRSTTLEDVDYVVDNLKSIIDKLRKMSPLYPGK